MGDAAARDAVEALLQCLMTGAADVSLFVRPAWHADAACREHPLDVFFPRREPGRRLADVVDEARQVCGGCLVRDDCRRWALARGAELHGIWAGLTERDRQELRTHPGHHAA